MMAEPRLYETSKTRKTIDQSARLNSDASTYLAPIASTASSKTEA